MVLAGQTHGALERRCRYGDGAGAFAAGESDGVLLIGVHFLTTEIGARMFGMQAPGIGVYRPNDNPVIDLIRPMAVCGPTKA